MAEQRRVTRSLIQEYLRDFVDTGIVAVITNTANLQNKRINVLPIIDDKDPEDNVAVEYPELLDVPIVFPSGGGAEMTFPLKVGNTVQLLVNQRSIDEWKASGKGGTPRDARMFSMNDCVAIPSLSLDATQDVMSLVITFAGGMIKISPNGSIQLTGTSINAIASQSLILSGQDVSITSGSTMTLSAVGGVTIGGSGLSFAGVGGGTIDMGTAGAIMHNGKDIGSVHRHGGIQRGSSQSDPVT